MTDTAPPVRETMQRETTTAAASRSSSEKISFRWTFLESLIGGGFRIGIHIETKVANSGIIPKAAKSAQTGKAAATAGRVETAGDGDIRPPWANPCLPGKGT